MLQKLGVIGFGLCLSHIRGQNVSHSHIYFFLHQIHNTCLKYCHDSMSEFEQCSINFESSFQGTASSKSLALILLNALMTTFKNIERHQTNSSQDHLNICVNSGRFNRKKNYSLDGADLLNQKIKDVIERKFVINIYSLQYIVLDKNQEFLV